MEQIIHVRILRFLQKIARMPGGRHAREILRTRRCTQTRPKENVFEKVLRPSTKSRWIVLLDSTSTDGAYDKWMHRFGQSGIGLHIDEHLGLEAGTYDGKGRNSTRI